MIAAATPRLMYRKLKGSTFGVMWRKIRRVSEAPATRAAATNGRSLMLRTGARMTRAIPGQPRRERTKMLTQMLLGQGDPVQRAVGRARIDNPWDAGGDGETEFFGMDRPGRREGRGEFHQPAVGRVHVYAHQVPDREVVSHPAGDLELELGNRGEVPGRRIHVQSDHRRRRRGGVREAHEEVRAIVADRTLEELEGGLRERKHMSDPEAFHVEGRDR